MRWVAQLHGAVGLLGDDPAAGLDQAGHLGDHLLRIGNVDRQQAGADEVERGRRQPRAAGVPLDDLDVAQLLGAN
jgi:hypothetical protein